MAWVRGLRSKAWVLLGTVACVTELPGSTDAGGGEGPDGGGLGALASLSLSDGPSFDFGTAAVGSSNDYSFTLTNNGSGEAKVIAASVTGGAGPFSFAGGTYPGAGGNCATSLAASSSCTLVVSFSPTTAGPFVVNLAVSYDDGASARTATVELKGNGAVPALLLLSDAPEFNFGAHPVGTVLEHTVSVSNGGGVAAHGLAAAANPAPPFAFKGDVFPGVGGTCTATLGASATCAVVVTYAPQAAGTFASTLSLSYHNGVATQSAVRNLVGDAFEFAVLSVSDGPTFDFGLKAVGSSTDRTFTVSNTGKGAATGLSVTQPPAAPFGFKGGSYPGIGGSCGSSLAGLGTCTVVLSFQPAAVGTVTSSFSLGYQDGAAAQSASRAVSGNAQPPALLALSGGPALNFGVRPLGSTTDQTLTVTNQGGVPAAAVAPSVSLAAPFSFGGGYPGNGGTCTGVLAPLESCTLVVTFAPTGVGSPSSAVSLGYNDGVTAQVASRQVQGTAVTAAALSVSDSPGYDFGTRPLGSTTLHSFVVTNSGGFAASSLASGAGLTSAYVFPGGFPGTGGDCTSTLGPGATCAVVLAFAPSALGSASATLTLDYNDGVAARSASRGVQGNAVAPALLTVSDGPTYDFGTLAVGASATHSFAVTNSGGFLASSMAEGAALVAPFSLSGGYPGAGGTCGASLSPGATCQVVVRWQPSSAGTFTGRLNLAYDDGVQAQVAVRDVAGLGASPALLSISGTGTFSFADTPVGGSTTHLFAVTNTGGVPATGVSATPGLSQPFAYPGGFPGTGGNCGATLAAAATCQVEVTFSPGATGTFTDQLTLTYADGVSAQTAVRPMDGLGVTPALLALSEVGTYDFGTQAVGSATDHAFLLSNTGGYGASGIGQGTALAAPFSYPGGFPGTNGTCQATLAAGASCQLVVRFSPAALGQSSGGISVSYQDGVVAQSVTRGLKGTGGAPAVLTISDGATYDFETQAVGSQSTHAFTVTNAGAVPATAVAEAAGLIGPFSLGGTFPGPGGTCGAMIPAGASCDVVVVYAPSAVGLLSASLALSYFDGAATQSTARAVQGTGAAPALVTVSGTGTYDFGNVVLGNSATHSFTLTNSGGVAAQALALGAGALLPFSFAGGFPGAGGDCGSSLAPGGSCSVVLTFEPGSAGVFSRALNIAYESGAGPLVAGRPVQGTGVAPARVTVSGSDPLDFGDQVVGSSTVRKITFTNAGGTSATGLSAGVLPPPFSWGAGFPGPGGTCGATLAGSGGSCDAYLTYSPAAPGPGFSTVTLDYFDGATPRSAQRNVVALARTPAQLVFAGGASPHDFGDVMNGTTVSALLSVRNLGGWTAGSLAPSAGPALPFGYTGGAYPGSAGNCGTSLAPGVTCTLEVRYSPTATGAASSSVVLAYNDGVSSTSVARTLQGTSKNPPVLTLSEAPSFSFGVRGLGTSTAHTFVVTNVGEMAATGMGDAPGLLAPFSYSVAGFPGPGGTCGTVLGPMASCTVVVLFEPAVAAFFSSSVSISHSGGLTTRLVTGTGTGLAFMSISDGPSYSFGVLATGTSKTHTFTLTNNGLAPATALSPAALTLPYSYPGGGTCGASLNPGVSCTLVVKFEPTAAGPAGETVTVNYHDGLANQATQRPVTGTGTSFAYLTVAGGGPYDFGTRVTGSSTAVLIPVVNTGGVAATSLSGSVLVGDFLFTGGTYPGTGGSCGASLGAGGSCNLEVAFSPMLSGPSSSTLTLTYDDGNVPAASSTLGLGGISVPPADLRLSDGPTFDFGDVAIGAVTSHAFTVTNVGGTAASSLSGSGLAGAFSFPGGFPGTGGTCGSSLDVGRSCLVTVRFAPTANGVAGATLTLGYQDGLGPVSALRSLAGKGVPPALLTVAGSTPASFGNVLLGQVGTRTLFISNAGGAAATEVTGALPTTPFDFAGGAFPGTGATCTATVEPGATCTVVAAFTPAFRGATSDTMTLSYESGAGAAQATRDVVGIGLAPATLSLSPLNPAVFSFGRKAVGSTTVNPVTVQNTGDVAATQVVAGALVAPFSYRDGLYPGTGGTCGSTIAAGATCALVVAFSPGALGDTTGALALSYENGTGPSSATLTLLGEGRAPASIEISDGPTYDFGAVAVGAGVATHIFFVTNTGGVPATELSGGGLANGFAYKALGTFPGFGGTCGMELLDGASCVVTVTFSPQAAGTLGATLGVAFYDGLGTRWSLRPVTGQGVTEASLVVRDYAPVFYSDFGFPPDGPTFDFGSVALNSPVDHVFTVSNTGGSVATGMSGGGLATPFSFPGGGFPGAGGTCGTSLEAGATCTVAVRFLPTATVTSTGAAILSYTAGATPKAATRNLQGAGTNQAQLLVSDFEEGLNLGPEYDFGTVGVGGASMKDFYVKNIGLGVATSLASLSMDPAVSFVGGAYPGQGGSCGTQLQPGMACRLVVEFSPSAEGGVSSVVGVSYFDGLTSRTASRSVKGSGTLLALLDIRDYKDFEIGVQYDFGTHGLGSATEHAFTVANTGGATAASMSGLALAAPFSFKGGAYPGTGGSCGPTLAAGATCELVVVFQPTAAQVFLGTVRVSYFDGLANQLATRAVTGAGTDTALLVVRDRQDDDGLNPFPYDFGTTGVPVDHEFTVRNLGAVSATSISAGTLPPMFLFKDGSYPGTGGNCGASLIAGASCTVVVTFGPVGATTSAGAVTMHYNSGAGTASASRAIVGTSTDKALLALSEYSGGGGDRSSEPIDFGITGMSTQRFVWVRNSGGGQATSVGAAALGNGFRFSGQGGTFPGENGTCGSTLNVGATCSVEVEFAPSTPTGFKTATLNVSYYDGSTARVSSRALSGTYSDKAQLIIRDNTYGGSQPPSYSFGTVGMATDHTFYVENMGAADATSFGPSAPPLGNGFQYKGVTATFPGDGGTCTGVVKKGESCTLVVTFAPSGAPGARSSRINLTYDDGGGSRSLYRDVSGTYIDVALLAVVDGPGQNPPGYVMPPFDFGTTGMAVTHTFYVVNVGGGTAQNVADGMGLGNGFAFLPSGYPGQGGTCGSSLSVGQSCSVVVTFAPTGSPGLRNSNVVIGYEAGGQPQTATRAVQGTYTDKAMLALRDWESGGDSGGGCCSPPFNFGSTGSTIEHTFYLRNTGGATASSLGSGAPLSNGFQFKGVGNTFPGTGGTCLGTLTVGNECTVVVLFAPTGQEGIRTSTLSVAYNDGAQVRTVSRDVKGTYVSGAMLIVSPWSGSTQGATEYDFGTVGAAVTRIFWVRNVGASPAEEVGSAGGLGDGFAYTGAGFPGAQGSCGATLNAGAECAVEVAFSPSGTPGARSAPLKVGYKSGASPGSAELVLRGTYTDKALLVIRDWPNDDGGGCCGPPPPYDFGTTGTSVQHTFYVKNIGGGVASAMGSPGLGDGFGFSGGGSYPGSPLGTCGPTLAVGAECTVSVAFAPTGTAGPRASTLTLSYNDGAGTQSVSRSLTGNYADKAFLVISDWGSPGPGQNPAPFDFGTVGTAIEHTFTVTNVGGAAASSLSGAAPIGVDFSYKGGTYPGVGGSCGGSLAVGQSCKVAVVFSPTGTEGPRSGQVTISHADGSSSRSVKGVYSTAPIVVVLDDEGQQPGGSGRYDFGASGVAVDHTFTVRNIGGTVATPLLGSSVIGQDFSFKDTGNYPGNGGTCTDTLAVGQQCTVVVRFAGTGPSGLRLGTVLLTFPGGSGQAVRDVQGTYVSGALLEIADNPGWGAQHSTAYDFGITGIPVEHTFELRNIGASTATITDPLTLGNGFSYKGALGYPGAGGTCSAALNAAASCTLVVKFAPTSLPAEKSSTLTLDYDFTGGSGQVTRALSGSYTDRALLMLTAYNATEGAPRASEEPDDFGTTGVPVTRLFFVRNVGPVSATNLNDGLTLGNGFAFDGAFPGSTGSCVAGGSLASGSTCQLNVKFTPGMPTGQKSSTISVSYFDSATPQTAARAVQGTYTDKALLQIVNCPGCGGGDQPYYIGTWGIPQTRTLTVKNVGGGAATSLSASSPFGGGFAFEGGTYPGTSGNCPGTTLAIGAQCSLSITFTPVGAGPRSGQLVLNYLDPGPRTATRDLSATATDRAYLILSENPGGPTCGDSCGPFGFQPTAVGNSDPRTFTVFNFGKLATTSLFPSTGFPAVPFSYRFGAFPGGGTCGAVLSPGLSCTVGVVFAPQAVGTFTSSFQLDYQDGLAAPTVLVTKRDVRGQGQ